MLFFPLLLLIHTPILYSLPPPPEHTEIVSEPEYAAAVEELTRYYSWMHYINSRANAPVFPFVYIVLLPLQSCWL